ncbi:unnamed protein product, partial [Effrenium voratum]
GVDYRRRVPGASKQTRGGSWVGGLADDGPAIAEIIQEGYKTCQRKPPAHFLRMLGARNAVYEVPASYRNRSASKPVEPHMRIEVVPPEKRLRQLPEDAVHDMVAHYEGPENILKETGMVGAASCETQAAPDPPGA